MTEVITVTAMTITYMISIRKKNRNKRKGMTETRFIVVRQPLQHIRCLEVDKIRL